jgi:tRNA(fMet)-specific endonuclease VapC
MLMNGRYLLDTNIIIALLDVETVVVDQIAQADYVFIPVIAVAELFYGARKSKRVKENLERIEDLLAKHEIVGCNVNTARQYGQVKNRLKLKGSPLPENDIWIAALALQYNFILVTRDAHFQEVDELQIVAW